MCEAMSLCVDSCDCMHVQQCLVADPAARPSAETVQNVLLICLANEDGDDGDGTGASCANVIPAPPPMPLPVSPPCIHPVSRAHPAAVQVAPTHRAPVHVTHAPHPKAPPSQCCALM